MNLPAKKDFITLLLTFLKVDQTFYEFNEANLLRISKQQKNISKRVELLSDKNMIGYLKKINTTIIDMTDAMMIVKI